MNIKYTLNTQYLKIFQFYIDFWLDMLLSKLTLEGIWGFKDERIK